jgi:hypothetical protein
MKRPLAPSQTARIVRRKKTQFLYLAIAPARFFRELHSALATRQGWGGRNNMTHYAKRDLEWWCTVPEQHNGRSIYRDRLPPRGLQRLRMGSRGQQKPRVPCARILVRHRPQATHNAELSTSRAPSTRVLPKLVAWTKRPTPRGQHGGRGYAYKFTTHSPKMMTELWRLWHMLDVNDIRIRPRYIRSAANI